MARWKLMVAHYLNTPGEEWEYTENDRKTGRPKRTKFPVPRYLDPKDPSCWTNRWGSKDNEEGEVIVCWDGKGDSNDVVFAGDPTPDMSPVDDEAREISATFEHRWAFKPENAEGDYSQSLVDRFQSELAEVVTKPIEVPGLAELTGAIGELVKQNQKVLEASTERRV